MTRTSTATAELVILDLDGTLTDSAAGIVARVETVTELREVLGV